MTKQEMLDLKTRGIAEQAEAMEWQIVIGTGRPRYRFPVWNSKGEIIGHRLKFTDGANPRYLWDGGQPENARYYFSPNAIFKIDAKQTVFVAEGEPDVLTLYAMGFGNSLCWLNGAQGMKNALETFFNDMQALGAKQIVYIPDVDYAGLKAAVQLIDAHQEQECQLKLRVLRVPGKIGIDLNEAYQQSGFNLNLHTFVPWIYDDLLEEIRHLKPKGKDGQRKGHFRTDYPNEFVINPALEDALVNRALEDGYKGDIDYKIGVLSFDQHKKDSPGAHAWFYRNSLMVKDYAGTGKSYLTSELVDIWGIDVEALGGWVDKSQAPPPKASPAPLKTPTSGNGHHKPAPVVDDNTTGSILDVIPPDFFVSGKQSMELAKSALCGDNPSIIIRNPVKAIHGLGGYANNLQGGKIMAIMAPSGAGKTTILETMAEYMLNEGKNLMFWGGEWNPLEIAQRRITRYGGASLNAMLEDALTGNLSDTERHKSIDIANNLQRGIPGQVYYINASYSHETLSRTLYYAGLKIEDLRKQGIEIHAFYLDYMQLVTLDSHINSRNMAEIAFEQFKQFVIQYELVGFVSSQVTKEAEDRIRDGGKLRVGDAQFIRLDKSNLFCGLAPIYAGGDEKERQSFLRFDVFKNSLGRLGHCYLDNRLADELTININEALNTKQVEDRLARLNDSKTKAPSF